MFEDTRRTNQPNQSMHWLPNSLTGFLILIFCLHTIPSLSQAQQHGDATELMRLQHAAEEAISVGDPQGAALNTGKAALMAAKLAKQETVSASRDNYHGLEALLRAQESVYRAMALFQQSGGHIPVSSGICQSLTLASSQQKKAATLLTHAMTEKALFQNLAGELQEWKETIEELTIDFQC